MLEKKDNPVLIFINPNEKETSTVIKESVEKNNDQYLDYTVFKQEGRIGVVSIREISSDKYELTIAVGGVKVTTETTSKDITKYAEEMMKIASSIKQ